MRTRLTRGIIVAYGEAAQLDRCLGTLAQAIEVTVVDNSSSEAVRAVAISRGARYLDAGANLGFGRGVNLALSELLAAGPPVDVLLLNPDAVLEPHELDGLAASLHRAGNERVAAVAPRLLGPDGREQRVAWPFPSPARAWIEALGLGRFPSRSRFVIGAVLLLRWDALQDVGLFDERFFLYAEEADWQRRARARGWVSLQCADATAEHTGSGTSSDERRREMLFHAAQETYIRKWHGGGGWLLYRAAACFGAAARAIVLTGERRSAAGRRAVLYLRGPRRRVAQLVD